jgi:hypothetical protein
MSKLPSTWTTRDGNLVTIAQMDDEHLVNTLLMLQRNVPVIRFRAEIAAMQRYETLVRGLHGEQAIDATESAIDIHIEEMVETSDSAWLRGQPIFRALKREAARRGIAKKTSLPIGGWVSEREGATPS